MSCQHLLLPDRPGSSTRNDETTSISMSTLRGDCASSTRSSFQSLGRQKGSLAPEEAERDVKAFHWWWWWEIAAAVLSITSMCLIIGVLSRVQGTRLEKWPWSIQPSSVISVLTTIGKTAMMVPITSCLSQLKWRHMRLRPRPLSHLQIFEDASRGPWGSAVLAWKLPFQSALGWVLALVTIIALGIEPCAQNILDFPSYEWNATDEVMVAGLAKADAFVSKSFSFPLGQTSSYPPELRRFHTAIVNSLFGATLDLNYNCPGTSNRCSWTNFTTLGVCKSFRNVTAQTTRNCVRSGSDGNFLECTYSVPDGIAKGPVMLRYGLRTTYESDFYYSDFSVDGDRIGQWIVVKHERPTINYIWSGYDPPSFPEVLVSNFEWCAKTYASINASAEGLEVGESVSEPLRVVETGNRTVQTANGSKRYEFSPGTVPFLAEYLQSIFKYKLSTEDPLGERASMDLKVMLYERTDLEKVGDNFAETVTNLVRGGAGLDNPGDNLNATMGRGEVFRMQTFVVVRWPWLILPVLVTLVTAVLLVVSIVMTAKEPLLKTSTMAFLAYPLSGWSDEEVVVQGPQSAEKLEKLAETLNGRFDGGDNRWRFVKA